jgi:hypothetical protein
MIADDPEDVPDEYLSDLPEEAREEMQDDEAFEQEVDERREAIMLLEASILFAKMFKEEQITLREYVELTEPLEEYHRQSETTIL